MEGEGRESRERERLNLGKGEAGGLAARKSACKQVKK